MDQVGEFEVGGDDFARALEPGNSGAFLARFLTGFGQKLLVVSQKRVA
jgi:hypothetical protein